MESVAKAVRPKAPNRAAYEKAIGEHTDNITSLKKELRRVKGEQQALTEKSKRLRDEKNELYKEKEGIEAHVRAMSAEINKVTDEQNSLRSKIPYRDEKRLEDTIKQLRRTQQNSNLRLSEEKKIVAEIDSLMRSKKFIRQFNEVTAELKQRKLAQTREREARERCIKRISVIRNDEESNRQRLAALKEKEKEIKDEIDEQNEALVKAKAELNNLQADYNRKKAEAKQAVAEKQELLRQERRDAVQADRLEMVPMQPYQEERNLCNLLINYLTSLHSTTTQNISAKQARKMGKKTLMHKTVTLNQFLKLNLIPPSTPNGISACLAKLKSKLEYYQELADTPTPPQSTNEPHQPKVSNQIQETDTSEEFRLDDVIYDFDACELEVPQSPDSPSYCSDLPIFCKTTKSDQDSINSSTEFIGLAELMLESWMDEKILSGDLTDDQSNEDVRVVA